MRMVLFNVISVIALFSPLFLLFLAWRRLLGKGSPQALPKWRDILSWASLLSVSGLLLVSIGAFLINNCNADLGDWSCVARWRSFTGFVICSSPFMIALSLFGRRGTRIPVALSIIAIVFDCVMVDLMA